MKIEFEEIKNVYDDGSTVDAYWNGTYTVGIVGCRGTRVWFKSNNVKCFDSNFDEDEEKDFYDELDGNESFFPGDDCVIRDDSLSGIINALELDSKINLQSIIYGESRYRYYDGNLDKLLDELWSSNSDLAVLIHEGLETEKELLNSYPIILVSLFPTQEVWLIKDKNRIIEELKEVLSRCNEKNVTWRWV